MDVGKGFTRHTLQLFSAGLTKVPVCHICLSYLSYNSLLERKIRQRKRRSIRVNY
jgi:hypothetical protein